jgi:hypothetical protein
MKLANGPQTQYTQLHWNLLVFLHRGPSPYRSSMIIPTPLPIQGFSVSGILFPYLVNKPLQSFLDVFNNANCFLIYPTSFRKVGCPLQGCYISCYVPTRFHAPIEILSEIYPDTNIGSKIQ